MPDFDKQWSEHLQRTVRMEVLLEEVRHAQEDRARDAKEEAKRLSEFDKRLIALEANAWTWAKFRAAWPQLAAFGTIVGLVTGLVVWLAKHVNW